MKLSQKTREVLKHYYGSGNKKVNKKLLKKERFTNQSSNDINL